MNIRIGLITIWTNNVKKLATFYSDVLGFVITDDLGNYIEFKSRGVRFAICDRSVMVDLLDHASYKEVPTGQTFELAFPVAFPDDVDVFYQQIIDNGATPIKEAEMMPWGRKTAFFADPDGNIHEIYSLSEEERAEESLK